MATRYVDPNSTAGGNGTTNALSGANRAYASLSEWESAREGTLTEVEEVICSTNGGAADTTACLIIGWDTTASFYIDIKTAAAYRHAGVWDTSKYRLEVTNASCVESYEDYIRYTGIQARVSSASSNYCYPLAFSAAAGDCRVIDGIMRGHRADYTGNAIGYAGSGSLTIRNVVAYDFVYTANTNIRPFSFGSGTVTLENVTGIGGYIGLNVNGGTVTAKNCYLGGSVGNDYAYSSGSLDKTNCASADASADDTAAGCTATNCINSVPVSTATFTNVTVGSENYSLVSGSGLIDVGVDLSGTFTTDIAGATRTVPWEIGPFNYTSAAAAVFTKNVLLNQAVQRSRYF